MATLRHQRSRGQLTIQGTPRLSPIASIVSSPELSSPSSDEGEGDWNEDDLITPTADSYREHSAASKGYFGEPLKRSTSFSALEPSPVAEKGDFEWTTKEDVRKSPSVDSLHSQFSQGSQQSSDGEAVNQRTNRLRNLLISRSRKDVVSPSQTPQLDTAVAASKSEESLWGTPVDADAVEQGLVADPLSSSASSLPESSIDSAPGKGSSTDSQTSLNTTVDSSIDSSPTKASASDEPSTSPRSPNSRDISTESTVATIESSLDAQATSVSKQRMSPLIIARNNIIADTKLIITKSIQKTCDRCQRSQKGLWVWCWTSQLLCQWCMDVLAKRVPLELKMALLNRFHPIDRGALQTVDLLALSRVANSLPHAVLAGLVPSGHRRLKARPSAPDDSFMDIKSRGASQQLLKALQSISAMGRYGSKLTRASSASHRLLGTMGSAVPVLASAHAGRNLLGGGSSNRRVSSLLSGQGLLPYVSSESGSEPEKICPKASPQSVYLDQWQPGYGRAARASRAPTQTHSKARSTDTFFSSDSDLSPPWSHDEQSGADYRARYLGGSHSLSSNNNPTSSEILNIDATFKYVSAVYIGMLAIDWRSARLWTDKKANAVPSSQMVLYTYPDDVLVCGACSENHLPQDDRAYILQSEVQEHVSWIHYDCQTKPTFVPLEQKLQEAETQPSYTSEASSSLGKQRTANQHAPAPSTLTRGPSNSLGLTTWDSAEDVVSMKSVDRYEEIQTEKEEDDDLEDDPPMTFY